MIEGERYKLRFADHVLDVDQSDLGITAVQRNQSVIAKDKNLSFGNNFRCYLFRSSVSNALISNRLFILMFNVYLNENITCYTLYS